MPLRQFVESGGEYLLSFAKQKIAYMHKQMAGAGPARLERVFIVTDGSQIFLKSLRSLRGQFIDTIRITASGSWDFYLQDSEFFGDQRIDYYFGQVGKPQLKKISVGRGDALGGAFASLRSSQLLFHDPAAGWRQIDKNQKLSAYAPTAFGGSVVTPAPTSSDTKVISVITNGADEVLTDGTNSVAVTTLGGGQFVVATKTNGFFACKVETPGVSASSRIVSLAESVRRDDAGNLVNPTGVLQDATWFTPNVTLQINPLANYTDLFTTFTDQGLPLAQIYRNGILETTSSTILALDAARVTICSKDTFSLWSFSGLDAKLLIGRRQSDGTYVYSANTYAFDSAYQSSFGSGSVTKGFSDAATYYFDIYIRTLVVGPDPLVIVTSSIDSSGVRSEAVAFPMTYAEYTAFPIAPITYFSIAFFNKSCFIGVSSKGTALRRHIFFYFSDGTKTIFPFPAGAADIVLSLAAGSKTVAYAHAADAGINYLADSAGSLTVLQNPTRLAADGVTVESAVAVLVGGFIDKKEGCALMFEAAWATAPEYTVHHWDATGQIFDYDRPALTYKIFPVIGVPAPTPLRRMELIESWGAP